MTRFPSSRPDREELRGVLWYILDARKCLFEFREKADAQMESTPEAIGVFQGLELRWFEGSGTGPMAKAPCYCACVSLLTEESESILLKVSSPVAYYVLAAKLTRVRSGDVICVRAEQVGNSCSIDLFVADGDGWRIPDRSRVEGVDASEKIAQGTARYFSHPDYIEGSEVPGPDGGIRGYRAKNYTPGQSENPTPAVHETRPVARQTHAQIPPERKPDALNFSDYVAAIGATKEQIDELIWICKAKRILANRLSAECQLANAETPAKALAFARKRKEEAA